MISNKSTTTAHKASKFLFFKVIFPIFGLQGRYPLPGPQPLAAAAMLVTKFRPPPLLCVPPHLNRPIYFLCILFVFLRPFFLIFMYDDGQL